MVLLVFILRSIFLFWVVDFVRRVICRDFYAGFFFELIFIEFFRFVEENVLVLNELSKN